MNGFCLLLVCLGSAAMVEALEPPPPLSRFRARKVGQHFLMANRIRDKILQMKDYKKIADNLLQIPGYDKYNASYIYDVLVFKAWEAYPNEDSTLEWIKLKIAYTEPDIIEHMLEGLTEVMYDVWDCREPIGCLSAKELEYELGNLGKVHDVAGQAQAALAGIDEDKDGCATLAEYQAAAICYFASEDPDDACTQFLGILDDY